MSVFQTKIGKNSPNYSNRYHAESYRLFLSIWERFTKAKLVNFQERYGAKFLNVFSGLNQPETDDPCARGRETKHKEARESNIIWRELKHRRNTSLWAEQRGAIKLVAFAENSKHNNGQNKGQNFRVFQGSKWNYKLDYTLWVPLIIIRIIWAHSFALFKSIFLRNQSLSNDRWFYGKKCKIGKRDLYLTENWLSGNKMWCVADNHNYMCHICAKRFLDSNFNWTVIDKISNFHKIAPNFTFSQNS